MRFRIDLKIFLIIFLFCLTGQITGYFLMFIFIIIHELGHLLAGLILGMKPILLEIIPQGLRIEFKIDDNDYNKKILKGNMLVIKKTVVAIAGPITNIILILIFINICNNIFLQINIIYTNVIIILFNILPIYPLDGGRILKGVIYILKGKRKAERYINSLSFIVLIVLTFFASILIYYYQNIAILIIILFLWCIHIVEDIKYRKKVNLYKLIDKTIEKKDIK